MRALHKLKTKKRIGIKYCGGCNPEYERVEMMERVQFRLSDRFLMVRDEPDVDLLILVSGCKRACAEESLETMKTPACPVTGEADFDNLIHWLKSFSQGGDS